MVNQQNCNVPFVRKLFQKTDILVVVRIQISVAARSTDTLQGVNHNKLCGRMLGQKLLDLPLQTMFERVRHNRKVQRRRCVLRQVTEPCLDTLERIFETKIQNFTLCRCKTPE